MASRTTMATVIGRTRCRAPAPASGQHDDDRLGAVGDRGQGVERERGEPLDRGDLLLGRLAGPQRPSDQDGPD